MKLWIWLRNTTIFLVICLVLFAVVIPQAFSKKDIEEAIFKTTQKEIHFENYSLTFFPTLGLTLSNVSFADETVNIKAKTLTIKIKLEDILNQTDLKIDDIAINTPMITLLETSQKEGTSNEPIQLVNIKHISIEDATFKTKNQSIKQIFAKLNIKDNIINIENATVQNLYGFQQVNTVGTVDLNKSKPYFNLLIKSHNNSIEKFAKAFKFKQPNFNNKNILKDIDLDLRLQGDTKKLKLTQSTLHFDESKLLFNVTIENLQSKNLLINLSVDTLNLDHYAIESTKQKSQTDYSKLIKGVNSTLFVKIKSLTASKQTIENFSSKVIIKNNTITLNPTKFKLLSSEVRGKYTMNLKKPKPSFSIQQTVKELNLAQLNTKEKLISGKANVNVNLSFKGSTQKEMLKTINGTKTLRAKNLTFYKYDVDELLSLYEETQKVNLLDIGAMFVAGPFASLLTQSGKFALLGSKLSKDGKTTIKNLSSVWKIQNGQAHTKDVAIRTTQNLIALKGSINLSTLQYKKMNIAVLDKRRCAKYNQILTGDLKAKTVDIKQSSVETFFSPVTSLLKSASKLFKGKCKPFYTGTIKY